MKSQLDINMQNDSSFPLREDIDDNNSNSRGFRRNIPPDHIDDDSVGTSDSPHQRQLIQHKERTHCFLIGLAVFISFISICLASFAIAKYSETANRLKLALENQGRLCLPCTDDFLQEPAWRNKNEYGECCVRQEDLLATLNKVAEARVDDALRREEHNRLSKQSSLSGTVNSTQVFRLQSAHLLIRSQQNNINTDTSGNHFLLWNDEQAARSSQHLEGVNYDETTGSIRITVSGYYFVYCQVGTIISDILTLNSGSLSYAIIKRSNYQDQVAIARRELIWRPVGSTTASVQETYLGGMINLNVGDSVFVRRESEHIRSDVNMNSYFGLFRV